MDIVGVGFGEVMVILVITLLAVGPRRLPEIAYKMGQLLQKFRNTTSELTRNITQEIGQENEDFRFDPRRMRDDIRKFIREEDDPDKESKS